MENVVLSVFAVESEAYQAFAELKQVPDTDKFSIIEAALIKNENGRVTLLDGFGLEERATDDTATGAVIGGLIGLLAGPFGLLLGAVAGGAIGSAVDAGDAMDDVSAIEIVAEKLNEGEIAVMAFVNETGTDFDAVFLKYNVTITRYEAAEIASEVAKARELEEELSKEARKKLREERKAKRAEYRAETREAAANYAQMQGEVVFNAVEGSSK